MEDLDIEGGGGLVEPIALRDDSVCCFRGHSGAQLLQCLPCDYFFVN